MLRSAVLVAALSLSMAGVAHAGLFSDDEAHKKIDDLQKQTVAQMQAMETRMAKMESQLSGQGLVDLLNQLEVLKTELNKLRGQLEVQTHELETTQKRRKDQARQMLPCRHQPHLYPQRSKPLRRQPHRLTKQSKQAQRWLHLSQPLAPKWWNPKLMMQRSVCSRWVIFREQSQVSKTFSRAIPPVD
jgi:regulator of replication initiation timing